MHKCPVNDQVIDVAPPALSRPRLAVRPQAAAVAGRGGSQITRHAQPPGPAAAAERVDGEALGEACRRAVAAAAARAPLRVCGEPEEPVVPVRRPLRRSGADPLMGVTLAVNRLRECSNSMNQLWFVCTNRFLGEVPINDHPMPWGTGRNTINHTHTAYQACYFHIKDG